MRIFPQLFFKRLSSFFLQASPRSKSNHIRRLTSLLQFQFVVDFLHELHFSCSLHACRVGILIFFWWCDFVLSSYSTSSLSLHIIMNLSYKTYPWLYDFIIFYPNKIGKNNGKREIKNILNFYLNLNAIYIILYKNEIDN